jgi:amino acid permease
MKKLAVPEAIAVLIGTIIGAGLFTLPYVAVHSGLATTLIWLIIVSFIITYLHLCFGEIVLRTKQDFRLPGYVGHYLDSSAKKFILLITFFTFSFSLLIYLLLGSQFLSVILSSN